MVLLANPSWLHPVYTCDNSAASYVQHCAGAATHCARALIDSRCEGRASSVGFCVMTVRNEIGNALANARIAGRSAVCTAAGQPGDFAEL